MKIRIAAAAPDIRPGAHEQNLGNILDLIRRAKADEAAVLVLPAPIFGELGEDVLERAGQISDGMPIYPLTEKALGVGELATAERMELLCCSADTPATASSRMEVTELAAMTSHGKKCAMALSCPLGGDGRGAVYDGLCVIAQNGFVLAESAGYVTAEVDTAKTRLKKPIEAVVEEGQLPTNPWVPMPDILRRAVELQIRGLADRLTTLGETRVSLAVDGTPQSLLALSVCAGAMDRLGLPHENIHAAVAGKQSAIAALALGTTVNGEKAGLPVACDCFTRIALTGCGYDDCYYVNCNMPETVVHLAVLSYASTCGDMRLGAVCRDSVKRPVGSAELDDFFLYYMQKMRFAPKEVLRVSQAVFDGPYEPEEIAGRQKAFYRRYRAARLDYPRWPEGPLVFGVALKEKR